MGVRPARSVAILLPSEARQVTLCPRNARQAPVVMPTYPVPMIETCMSEESAFNVTLEVVLVQIHADAAAAEPDALVFQPDPLLHAGFARKQDLPPGADHSVPRNAASASQCPNHLTGGSREARG